MTQTSPSRVLTPTRSERGWRRWIFALLVASAAALALAPFRIAEAQPLARPSDRTAVPADTSATISPLKVVVTPAPDRTYKATVEWIGPDGPVAGAGLVMNQWSRWHWAFVRYSEATTDADGIAVFHLPGDTNNDWSIAVDRSLLPGYRFSTALQKLNEPVLLSAKVPAVAPRASKIVLVLQFRGRASVALTRTPAGGAAEDPWYQNTDDNNMVSYTVSTDATASYRIDVSSDNYVDASYDLGTVTPGRFTTLKATAPLQIVVGAKAKISGTFSWSDTQQPLASQGVELWSGPANGPLTRTAIGRTDYAGSVEFLPKVSENYTYQLRADSRLVGDDTTIPASSEPVSVNALRTTIATAVPSKSRVNAGTEITLTGTLRWDGSSIGLPLQPVELWARPAAGRWASIGITTTDKNGKASWPTSARFTTTYQLRSAGGNRVGTWIAAPTASPVVISRVVAKITVAAPRKPIAKTSVVVNGKVTPAASGQKVAIQVNKKTAVTVRTDSRGSYSAKVRFPRGTSSLRARVATSSYSEGANSSTLTVAAH